MNFDQHPCFNAGACKDFGRVHLPVAPACNIQCNFCNRKYDCVNESRPGVTSSILSPDQAMAYLADVVEAKPNTTVVGIAGPGDPFANPVQTMETLRKVRQAYPDMMLCLATNGLGIAPYIEELAGLKVSHVTITVNTVDPDIGKKIYSWVRYKKRTIGPEMGAATLLEHQLAAIKKLKEHDIIVKVNTIILQGINDHHIEAVAEKMSELKVDILNCIPYYPTQGANLEHLEEPSVKQVKEIRKSAKKFIPQMTHCKRCRADAVGLLGDPVNTHLMERLSYHANAPIPFPMAPNPAETGTAAMCCDDDCTTATAPTPEKTYVAVASREGVLINQHLGEASALSIYDIRPDTPELVAHRELPEPGTKDIRWFRVAETIKDCHTLMVSGIGANPKDVLTREGVNILEINGMIDLVLSALKNNEDLSHLIVRERRGGQCQGTGTGCM